MLLVGDWWWWFSEAGNSDELQFLMLFSGGGPLREPLSSERSMAFPAALEEAFNLPKQINLYILK